MPGFHKTIIRTANAIGFSDSSFTQLNDAGDSSDKNIQSAELLRKMQLLRMAEGVTLILLLVTGVFALAEAFH